MTNIFISYRRDDSRDAAGRICDRLKTRFGSNSVFMDVENIPLGTDFRTFVGECLDVCDVVLAVIGDDWLINDQGPSMNTRIEISTALKRGGIPIIPVLVGSSPVPSPEQLPDDIKELSYRNGIEIRSDRSFEGQMDGLITAIEAMLQQPRRNHDARNESGSARNTPSSFSLSPFRIALLGGFLVFAVGVSIYRYTIGLDPVRWFAQLATENGMADKDSNVNNDGNSPSNNMSGHEQRAERRTMEEALAKSNSEAEEFAKQLVDEKSKVVHFKEKKAIAARELANKRVQALKREREQKEAAEKIARLEAEKRLKLRQEQVREHSESAAVRTVQTKDPVAAIAASGGYTHLTTMWVKNDNLCFESNKPQGQNDLSGGSFMTPCGNFTGQLWKLEIAGRGYYLLRSMFTEKENLCLEGNEPVTGASMGGAAFMAPCGNFSGQLWRFQKDPNGFYKLQTMASVKANQCLEGNKPGPNNYLQGKAFMGPCSDVSGQYWTLKKS